MAVVVVLVIQLLKRESLLVTAVVIVVMLLVTVARIRVLVATPDFIDDAVCNDSSPSFRVNVSQMFRIIAVDVALLLLVVFGPLTIAMVSMVAVFVVSAAFSCLLSLSTSLSQDFCIRPCA